MGDNVMPPWAQQILNKVEDTLTASNATLTEQLRAEVKAEVTASNAALMKQLDELKNTIKARSPSVLLASHPHTVLRAYVMGPKSVQAPNVNPRKGPARRGGRSAA